MTETAVDMLEEIDLRELASWRAEAGEGRIVTTLYLRSPRALNRFTRRVNAIRKLLTEHPEERAQFEANLSRIEGELEASPFTSGGVYMVCCAKLDKFLRCEIPLHEDRLPREDGLWFTRAPYLRPLAELKDEFEQHVVIFANNTSARVELVSAGKHEQMETLLGEIKNSVKKGGWSQQRYARRRAKQIDEYALEISDALERLERHTSFDRVLLLGSSEILQTLPEKLPRRLRNKIDGVRVIASRETNTGVERIAAELFEEAERVEEREIWEEIREEALQQGRALLGAMDVQVALQQGRVQTLLVQRDVRIDGTQCKACGHTALGVLELCVACGGNEPHAIDMINEFVEAAVSSGATIEFSDTHEELAAVEGIAALLRY